MKAPAEDPCGRATACHRRYQRRGSGSSIVDGEPQHVTVLSIEIVSPLHGFASVNADMVLQQMDPLFELTHAIVEQHGGIFTASGNSGITALFGSSNRENHAAAACRVALAVKSMIEAQSEASACVRAGLDSGEVIVRYRRHGAAASELRSPALPCGPPRDWFIRCAAACWRLPTVRVSPRPV